MSCDACPSDAQGLQDQKRPLFLGALALFSGTLYIYVLISGTVLYMCPQRDQFLGALALFSVLYIYVSSFSGSAIYVSSSSGTTTYVPAENEDTDSFFFSAASLIES